jgi:hypothetical protein
LFVSAVSSAGQSTTPTDVQATLSRAEALYDQAQFQQAIQLLTPLDVALRNQPDRARDSIAVKLQLALAYVGLDEMSAAKARFEELCGLDPEYKLDPQQFAPKILELFNEAQGDQSKARCSAVCAEAKRLLNEGILEPLAELISTSPKSCSCLTDAAREAADMAQTQGLEAYNNGDFEQAQQSFKIALALDSQNALAAQYIDLTDMRFQLEVDRLVLDWRKNFEAHNFQQAGTIYFRLASPRLAQKAGPVLDQIRADYRKETYSIADAWKKKCAADPRLLPDESLNQARGMLPNLWIAQDIIAQIKPCAVAPPETAERGRRH